MYIHGTNGLCIMIDANPNLVINPKDFFRQNPIGADKYDLHDLINRIYNEYIISTTYKKGSYVKELGIPGHVFRSLLRLIISAMKTFEILNKKSDYTITKNQNEERYSYKDFLHPATEADNETVGNVIIDKESGPQTHNFAPTFSFCSILNCYSALRLVQRPVASQASGLIFLLKIDTYKKVIYICFTKSLCYTKTLRITED